MSSINDHDRGYWVANGLECSGVVVAVAVVRRDGSAAGAPFMCSGERAQETVGPQG